MVRSFAAVSAAVAFALLTGSASAAETYIIDPVHSQPMFEVQHMGFSMQRGSFNKVAGKVMLDRAAGRGSIDVTIDTTSVRTIDPRLDERVKGEDFFDIAHYPTMTFRSSKLNFEGDRITGAEGDLTMLGVTRPVALKVSNFACGEHPINKRAMCGAEVTTTIKRSAWGMNAGIPKAVGDDVRIAIPIEAYRE
jgi:polyisoprenoid-binding protein YceI